MPTPVTLRDIIFAVFRLNSQITEWGNHFAAPFGLNTARWQTLGAIALAASAPNVPQIAEKMGMTRQGALKQVNQLVEEGLVQAIPNPAHKRSPLYILTAKGEAAFSGVRAQWRAHTAAWLESFDTAELSAAIAVLERLDAITAAENAASRQREGDDED